MADVVNINYSDYENTPIIEDVTFELIDDITLELVCDLDDAEVTMTITDATGDEEVTVTGAISSDNLTTLVKVLSQLKNQIQNYSSDS